jgi:acyl-CoA thioester hydrolase
MKIRVYYEDTDAGGVVYHTNYIKYCERARSELFFQAGKSPAIAEGHFLLKHLECDFIRSAKLGDLLEAKHELIEFKNASLTLKQSIYLDETKIFEMTCLLVYVKNAKPSKIDEKTKEFMQNMLS